MIETYGWRIVSGLDFAPFAARGLLPGRLIVQQRGHCVLATEFGELAAGLAGRLLHDGADPPVAGDQAARAAQHKRWVALTKSQRAARKFREL
jgi:ribosome biogenesis GTPase